MADIFISYASADRSRVESLAKAIEELGWTVWWDRTILPGNTYDQIIEEAIAAANCVVVIWSKKSVTSDWVKEEASFGKRRNILVPANIESVDPPFGFGLIQAANLTEWQGGTTHPEFRLLVRALTQKLGQPPNPLGQAIKPEREISFPQEDENDDWSEEEKWFKKGNILDSRGQYEDAISAFDEALSIKPDYAEAWANKGISFKRLGRYQDAINAFDRALDINPEYGRVRKNRADVQKLLRRKK